MFDEFDDDTEMPNGNGYDIEDLIKKYKMHETGHLQYFEAEEFEELANYFLESGKLTKSSEVLSEGLKLYPTHVEFMIEKANILIHSNKPRKALEFLNTAKLLEPTNGEIYELEGLLFDKEGKHDRAIEAFEKAKPYSDNPDLIISNIAHCYCSSGRYSEAIKALDQGLKKFPNNTMLCMNLGMVYMVSRQLGEGIEYFTKRLDLEPYGSQYWLQLGRLYEFNEEREKAINAYEYAGLTDKRNDNSFFSMGCLLEDSERYEEAIENFRLAYDLDAHNSYTGICLARCYIAVKELTSARRILREISVNGELFSEGYYLFGISYMMEEKYERAIPYLKRASKTEPDEITNILALASCYAETDKEDQAFSFFTESLTNASFTEYWSDWIMMFYLSGHEILCTESKRIITTKFPELEEKITQLNWFIKLSESPKASHLKMVLNILMYHFEDMFPVFKKNFPEVIEKHQEISELISYFENFADDDDEPGTI